MGNFKEDIASVTAFVLDVDGVLTDGGIIPLASGDFIRRYHAKDGYALSYAIQRGYHVGIITGGRGENLRHRLAMLGISTQDIYMDCLDKLTAIEDFIKRHKLRRGEVLYMGDDIPDLPCMHAVGMPVCPADAAWEIIETARYVSGHAGGAGCVRDVVEQTLRARADWATDTHVASR